MLIILGGLPATGKTTTARCLARALAAVHVRIDSLEQALVRSGALSMDTMGPAGYFAAYAMAKDNLLLGLSVVADSVNPLRVTRDAWRTVAVEAGTKFLEIELVCSDNNEHRRRVTTRVSDIAHMRQPDWQAVCTRDYEVWDREHLVLDTALLTTAETVDIIIEKIQHTLIQ